MDIFESMDTRHKNAFAAKGITNEYILRRWYPLRYYDNTKETGISKEYNGKHITAIATLLSCEKKAMKSRYGNYLYIKLKDNKTDTFFNVTIFGMIKPFNYLFNLKNQRVIVGGMLNYDPKYGFSITNPDVISSEITYHMNVKPVYSSIKGVSDSFFDSTLKHALLKDEEETLKNDTLLKYDYPGINEALNDVMSPNSLTNFRRPIGRLIFDDMFYLSSKFELKYRAEINKKGKIKINKSFISDNLIDSLPYSLTKGQYNAYLTIKNSLYKGEYLNCLIQGDVGCGKTIIAFLSALLLAENGYQCIIMVPRQTLAMQHYLDFTGLVKNKDINAALVTGDTVSNEIIKEIKDGKVNIIIGTSAVLSEKITYKNLGLLITDEEHIFGTDQKDFSKKYTDVNSILMSATPIPRTLASSLYGSSAKIFSIKEKPGNRKPIITYYDNGTKYMNLVKKALLSNRQVYVVCPMIDDIEDKESLKDILSVQKAYDVYTKALGDKYNIAVLNGKMSSDEAEKILNDFRDNKINVLISTTVIEVGINVPNATLIVIHNAERFGLAQLHQLRGRVGRGSLQSYCVIQSPISPLDNERLMTICTTSDGFEIAEKDLLYIRKSGNIFGNEQSGRNKYIEYLYMYPDIYENAKNECKEYTSEELMKHINKIEQAENKSRIKLLKLNP